MEKLIERLRKFADACREALLAITQGLAVYLAAEVERWRQRRMFRKAGREPEKWAIGEEVDVDPEEEADDLEDVLGDVVRQLPDWEAHQVARTGVIPPADGPEREKARQREFAFQATKDYPRDDSQ